MHIEWGTILSIVIGGAITLLGTLLSTWLQHHAERRELKRERLKEEFAKIREYLRSSLNLANLFVSLRGIETDDPLVTEDFMKQFLKEYECWISLPVSSVTWFLFTEDKETIEYLGEFAGLMTSIVNKVSGPFEMDPKVIDHTEKRLKELAGKVNTRLNVLLGEV